MVVRSWSELDFDNVCSNAKVFGFDLDNTLASSKQPMKPAMIERFCALLDHTVVALISGGGMAVVTSQVLDVLTPNARRGNLHVMPTSGSRYYRWDGTQWALVYAHDLSEATVAAVSESLERHARELGLWEQQVWGGLGDVYKRQKKQALVEAVKADLPHMRVRAGGYTSVDVSECGIDKAYAVRKLTQTLGIRADEMVFVGDRMTPTGNDYPAVEAGAIGVRVENPQDTVQLLDALLARFDTPAR